MHCVWQAGYAKHNARVEVEGKGGGRLMYFGPTQRFPYDKYVIRGIESLHVKFDNSKCLVLIGINDHGCIYSGKGAAAWSWMSQTGNTAD